jgi:hypothetical protein
VPSRQLAAVGITYGAWRNTHLEALDAGDHPTGGFPDEDMMRLNVATTKLVSEYVTADGVDSGRLSRKEALAPEPRRHRDAGLDGVRPTARACLITTRAARLPRRLQRRC